MADSGWPCPACTFVNDGGTRTCAVCGEARAAAEAAVRSKTDARRAAERRFAAAYPPDVVAVFCPVPLVVRSEYMAHQDTDVAEVRPGLFLGAGSAPSVGIKYSPKWLTNHGVARVVNCASELVYEWDAAGTGIEVPERSTSALMWTFVCWE